MSVRVIQDTHGAGLAALQKRLRALADRRVLVGVPKGPEEADGLSVAQVAAYVEFGGTVAPHSRLARDAQTGRLHKRATFEDGITIPARPFLRPGIRNGLPAFRRIAESLLPRVVEGSMSADNALGVVGLTAASAVQRAVIDEPAAPNAPSTIAKKGSSRPRVDSGSLRQSITHVVEPAGGGVP